MEGRPSIDPLGASEGDPSIALVLRRGEEPSRRLGLGMLVVVTLEVSDTEALWSQRGYEEDGGDVLEAVRWVC